MERRSIVYQLLRSQWKNELGILLSIGIRSAGFHTQHALTQSKPARVTLQLRKVRQGLHVFVLKNN